MPVTKDDENDLDHDFVFDLEESRLDLKEGRIVADYNPRALLAEYRASQVDADRTTEFKI